MCSQFPPLSTYEERKRYKQIFNTEYVEYLQLKDDIDDVASNYSSMCSQLGERLHSVPKHSDEYKVGVGPLLGGVIVGRGHCWVGYGTGCGY